MEEKHKNEQALIKECLKNNRNAQRALYERFGPRMKAVCMRYCYNRSLAEEVMNKGFYKVFKNLASFRNTGSFEGWIRKIMVRECLDENKKNKLPLVDGAVEEYAPAKLPGAGQAHDAQYLLNLINALPYGYRMVFNLYEVEGYSHREIAKQLGISESASRSQLTRAKKILQKQIKDLQKA